MALLPMVHGDDDDDRVVANDNNTTKAITDLIRDNKRSRDQEKEAFSRERARKSGQDGRDAVNDYFERFKRDDDEIMFRKQVISKLGMIQTTLEQMLKSSKEENKGLLDSIGAGLMKLLPALIPLVVAALSAAKPEAVKPYQTLVKSGMMGAGVAADAIKGAKYASEAAHGAKALGAVGKALGKFSDNKHLGNLVRVSSGAMIAGRALEGDVVGAVGEGASLGMHEAAQRAKNPKAKALLTAGSLATDAALIVRDWFREDDKKKEDEIRKQEADRDNGIVGTQTGGGGGGGGAIEPTTQGGAFENIKNAAIVTMPALIAIALPLIMTKMKMGGLAMGGTKPFAPNTKFNLVSSTAGAAAGAGAFSRVGGRLINGAADVAKDASTISKVATVAKGGAKLGAKSLPLLGLGLGAYGATTRAMDGDYIGALGEAASGIVSTVPVIGTAASLAIQGGLMYRDSVNAANANTEKLNSVATDNITKMDAASSNMTAQVASSNDAIVRASDNTINNTNQMTANVNDASNKFISTSAIMSTSIIGFTTNLGNKIVEWTIGADNIFKRAAQTMSAIGSGIWEKIKTGASGAWNTFTGGGDALKYGSSFGSVSEKFESGGRGVATVSTGRGDKGGVSYGKHQLSSKSGTMQEFLNSKYGAAYKGQFAGMAAGSAQFTAKYKQIAASDGANFEKAQKGFITATHYTPVAQKIKAMTGVDVGKRGRAVQELVYSMSVQYRNNTPAIWVQAIGKDGNKLSDNEIIERVMNRRARGVDVDFRSSDGNQRNGIRKRIETEHKIYRDMQAKGVTGSLAVDAGGVTAKPQATGKNTAKTGSTTATKVDNTKKKGGGDVDFDLDKICQYAVTNASPKSIKKCAEYVRKALQAGDSKKKIKGGMGDAREWGKSLPAIGWQRVSGAVQKGDIAWFPTGMSGYGHVCIWTGSVWVSDFIQKTVQPSSGANLQYFIYRAKSGYTNGVAIGTAAAAGAAGVIGAEDGVSGGAEGTEGEVEKSAIEKAQDAVTTGIAAVADALFNNDTAKAAVNFFDTAKIDGWDVNAKENKKDAVNMTGFDKELKGQKEAFKYAFGDAGVDRNKLFDRNAFERQKAAPADLLGAAGDLGGIKRQLGSPTDLLGNAGKIDGVPRQEESPVDWLDMAGNLGGIQRQQGAKKKKKRWYDRLFGDKDSALYGQLFDIFGMGDIFDLGSEVYGANKTGNLDEYGLKKMAELNKDNEFGAVFGEAGKILTADKNGQLGQYGLNKMQDILGNMNGQNSILTPDYVGRNQIDGIISDTNKKYADFKNAPQAIDKSGITEMTTPSSTGSTPARNGGNSGGLSAALITRNPDSIFREVSIAVMKATIT